MSKGTGTIFMYACQEWKNTPQEMGSSFFKARAALGTIITTMMMIEISVCCD